MRYVLTPKERAFCEGVLVAGPHAVKYHTFALVEDTLADGVPGDFAECGVMAGGHPAIMLYVLRKHGVTDRKVHLFDSFQGIPRATEKDAPEEQRTYGLSDGSMRSSGVSASSVENTLRHLRTWGVLDERLVVVHPGWFEETLQGSVQAIRSLALLRVDVDLYESTRLVYTHLYAKVSAGGYVCDDDYGFVDSLPSACRRAMESVIGPQQIAPVDGCPTTVWWRKDG